MTRKLIPVLGVALIAALAAGALTAPAEESNPVFAAIATPSGEPVTALVEGEPEGTSPYELFHAGVVTVKCKKASYQAELPLGSAAVMVVWPQFEECTAGVLQTHVTVSGCNIVIKAGQKVNLDEYAGELGIGCLEGAEIDFRITENGVTKCTVQVPDQGYRPGVTNTDQTESTPPDVTTDISISNIEYTTVGSAVGCAGKPTGTYKDGAFTSAIIFRATKSGEPIDFSVID